MGDEFEQRVLETTRRLRESCVDWGIAVAGDWSVTEAAAEKLLGYRVGTFRAQRNNGACQIPRRLIGNTWRYRLDDLAHYIELRYDSA